jgi:peptidoglycan/xylan/chitin deacetylase (PgdA/CDA1 family)
MACGADAAPRVRLLIMRWLAHASREVIRLAQPLVPRASRGVTILIYHLVDAGTQSPVDVPLDMFRAQLAELREVARVCSLDDALASLESGIESPRPLVVITFDDGFDNFRTRAWPLLEELDVPCTLYVPVGFIEGTSGMPLSGVTGLKPLSWSAIRALASERLMTIGSHSWHHRDMRALDRNTLRWDLRHSRQRLQERTGAPIEHFCYPRAKWSYAAEAEVGGIYRTAVVAGGRQNVPGRFHPLRLARTPVRRDMPIRLAPVVQSTVWLEEWAASHARAFL